MADKQSLIPLYERSPVSQLVMSLLIVMGAGLILFSCFLLAGTFIFDANLRLLENLSSSVGKNETAFLKYMLISQDISIFIVPAIIILKRLKPADQRGFSDLECPTIDDLFLVVLLAFCIFPVTSFTLQINSGMDLPDWLSGVEKWMIEKENSATRLLDIFMAPCTFWTMILNVMIIAVLPAIGEELIFRGVFQKLFHKLFRSGNVAVWVTAILFSTIHFQFYGFLPRFILGLIFGYLFLWSGKLWLPILAHFVNNAVPTIGACIQHLDKVNANPDFPVWKQMIFLPLPVIISFIILLYFRNKGREKISV